MGNDSGSWRYRRERRAPRPVYTPPLAPAPSGEPHGPRTETDQWYLDLPIEQWALLMTPLVRLPEMIPLQPEPTWPGAYDGVPAMRAELRMLLDRGTPRAPEVEVKRRGDGAWLARTRAGWRLATWTESRDHEAHLRAVESWWSCADAAWCVLGYGETYADHAEWMGRSVERARQRVHTAVRVCQHWADSAIGRGAPLLPAQIRRLVGEGADQVDARR